MKNVWEHCWDQWDAKPSYEEDVRQHRAERGPLYELFEPSLAEKGPSPLRILEVGCGTAIDASFLAQQPSRQVIGIDFQLGALRVAQKISASFPCHPFFSVSDATRLSFPNQTFDLVFSQGLLEHFRDPMPLLQEQVRVLKKGGTLVVDVPQRYAGFGTYSLRKHWKIARGKWPWGWETEFSCPQIKRMGKSLGLVPTGATGYGFDGLLNLFAHPDQMIDKWPFLRRSRMAQAYKQFYLRRLEAGNRRFWDGWCRAYGHWFLICVAVRFRKP